MRLSVRQVSCCPVMHAGLLNFGKLSPDAAPAVLSVLFGQPISDQNGSQLQTKEPRWFPTRERKPARREWLPDVQQPIPTGTNSLKYLPEARRLDVLEQRSSRRQPIRIRERNIESPVTCGRAVDRAVGVVLTERLHRVVKRNHRAHKIPTGRPVLQETWKIMHAAVQPRLAPTAIALIGTGKQR